MSRNSVNFVHCCFTELLTHRKLLFSMLQIQKPLSGLRLGEVLNSTADIKDNMNLQSVSLLLQGGEKLECHTHTHTHEFLENSRKGQSAIEYLTTYGWMLLVIAIVGGAIFTTVQNSGEINYDSFDQGNIGFVQSGFTSNGFQMELRNQEADQMHVEKITLSSEETGEEVTVIPDETLPVGDTATFDTIGLADTNTRSTVDIEVTYDSGGLDGLTSTGSMTGAFSLDTEAAEPSNGEWVFVDVSETPDRYMDTSGMSDFYLMKYEARNDGGTAVSESGTSIYRNINQTDARQKCQAIGGDLVSDRQWNAVAHQAAVNPNNWADGNGSSIGSGGGLYSGNTGDSDSVSYDGPNPDPSDSNATKRTLELANGDKVWDLSGNVWEWTSNSFRTEDGGYESPRLTEGSSVSSDGWRELNEISVWNGMPSSSGTNSSWDANEGIGRIYLNGDHTWGPDGQVYNVSAVQRGGHWYDGQHAGVFSAHLSNAPSNSHWNVGFRCSLSPAS